MCRNPEYYPDPTAGAALRQLRRKENRLNTGKQFEADWKKSIPPDAWCYRLKDSAATYYGGNENLSFSVDNICDFEVYRYPLHHYFELKTIETPSIPLEKILGKFDRDKQRYHKLKHITDMAAAASYKGQTAHVVINYRGRVNRTFAVPASAVQTAWNGVIAPSEASFLRNIRPMVVLIAYGNLRICKKPVRTLSSSPTPMMHTIAGMPHTKLLTA